MDDGHEKNEIKFICISQDCPKRLQKGCAYCMIKYHAKHLDDMIEIEYLISNTTNNFNLFKDLYAQS